MASNSRDYVEGRINGVLVALRVILMSDPGSRVSIDVKNYKRTLCVAILNGERYRTEITQKLENENLWPI